MKFPCALENVFCCCWAEGSIQVSKVNLVDNVLQVIHILTDSAFFNLSITDRGVLTFPTITVNLSISPFNSI